jgi:DNA segregation ATPase FtsK/SpoIIIE-like protein
MCVIPVSGNNTEDFAVNSLGRGDEKRDKNKASVITRETVGMTMLLFGAIIFFIAVTGPIVFGAPGTAITAFFLGLFGYFFYPLDLFIIYLGVSLISGKKFISGKWLARGLFLIASVFLIVHTATAEPFVKAGYGGYLSGCWKAAGESAANGTGGGVLFGLIAFPVRFLLSAPGAYVFFSLLTALSVFLILWATPFKRLVKGGFSKSGRAKRQESVRTNAVEFDDLSVPAHRSIEEPLPQTQFEPLPSATKNHIKPVSPEEKEASRDILFSGDRARNYRENLIFDRDSQFNTTPRRSSVKPLTEGQYDVPQPGFKAATVYEPSKPDYAAPVYTAPSYSERYSSQAETVRPAMPRKITPAEKISPAEDAAYTPTPSYRAPSAALPETNDFYAHDVAPAKEESVEESRQEAEETPARGYFSFGTDFRREEYETPVSRAPVKPVRDEREILLTPAPEEPVQEEADELPASRTEEDSFRNLFARPVERTEAREEPQETALAAEAVIADPFDRRETRFGFGADVQPPEEEEAPSFRTFEAPARTSSADLFDSDDEPEIDDADFRAEPDAGTAPVRTRSFEERGFRESGFRESHIRETAVSEEPAAPAPQPKRHVYKPYRRPGYELFVPYDDTVTVSQEEIEHNSSVIVDTLAGFRVDAEVVKVRSGSSVTRYDIDIPKNIAVRMVVKRDAEIAMRLHARDGVNIYPNSEVGVVSIEVPNSKRATVGLRSVLMADEYVNAKPNSLMFAIGKDIEGRNVCGNIVKMKHILVAGSTGSGKSVCLNAMLISLICRYSPEELRLILIDPKKVEFAIFDGLPHLMINEIIADAQKAVTALNWAIKEMERRYTLFERKTRGGVNVHNLDEYNACLTEDEERLPKIVIVVDELADLMSVAKKDIEDRIQRLAQKARAAGMHLVIATQRPSVDVITGVIKGNLPTRLAFRVIQEVDSRTILDESGAEKLLGNGDMLYRTEGMFNCLRVQGAFISSQEVQAVIENIKANNEAYFDDSVADYINKTNQSDGARSDADDADDSVDPQYIKALAIVVKLGSASISLIQRKCSVGYNHAGKIMEWMEIMGYVAPFDGKAKARAVILTKEEFEAKYGSLD